MVSSTTRLELNSQNDAAADASTPSSKHLTIPVPLPPSTSLTIPQDVLPSAAPIASPIPLSASTMLAFPESSSGIIKPEPKNEFEFNILPTLPSNNGIGDLDLANMNMSDFAAMMASNGFDYSTMAQTPIQNNNIPNPPIQNPRPTTIREQSDTDRLLAQLGAFTGPDTSNTMNQAQLGAFTGNQVPSTNTNQQQSSGAGNVVNDEEVNALLASLNDGNVGGGDYSNFDFGDIDLGNLGDMSGLFGTTTVPGVPDVTGPAGSQPGMTIQTDTNTNANMPDTNTNTMVSNAQPVQVPSQPQQQPQAQQQPIPTPVKQEPLNPTSAIDPNFDMSNVFDESQAIDLDDFNFGDGDGEEGGIDLTGDEFENLLAAFN